MAPSTEDYLSSVGLTIQVAGVACVALLFHLLYRALPRAYLQLWRNAWLVMAAALIGLRIAIAYPGTLWPLQVVYFLGEYLFAFLLAAGFASYPERAHAVRIPFWAWLPGLLWGVLLTLVWADFTARFAIHAVVFAALLGYALASLWRMRLAPGNRWAHAFATISLGLLALDFFVNGFSLIALPIKTREVALGYSAYQSIVDLSIEMLVAFGLVAIAAVDLRATLERAHAAVEGERDRMSMLANQDALTGCFNRLALDELKLRIEQRHGSVAMIDVNGLKSINDRLGHAMGDLAIGHVARALKAILRGHDPVFRIGGDEFVLVLFDLPPTIAMQRLEQVQQQLAGVVLAPGVSAEFGIAYGVAEFRNAAEFEAAMATADTAMYAHKRECHAARRPATPAAASEALLR